MFASLILAAFVTATAPAQPAWEALACTYCEASDARAIGWSFEAATAERGPRAWADYIVPDALRGRRFATQRECLGALRASLPAVNRQRDDVGQITTRFHRRDHISEVQSIPGVQSGSAVFGCFQHAQPTS